MGSLKTSVHGVDIGFSCFRRNKRDLFCLRRKQLQALYIKTDEPLEAPASYDTDRYK
jgi:hypothetical protein